jgi:hypothetical protein
MIQHATPALGSTTSRPIDAGRALMTVPPASGSSPRRSLPLTSSQCSVSSRTTPSPTRTQWPSEPRCSRVVPCSASSGRAGHRPTARWSASTGPCSRNGLRPPLPLQPNTLRGLDGMAAHLQPSPRPRRPWSANRPSHVSTTSLGTTSSVPIAASALETKLYAGVGNRHLLRPSQSWEAHVRPRSALPAEDGQNPLHRDQGRANMYE